MLGVKKSVFPSLQANNSKNIEWTHKPSVCLTLCHWENIATTFLPWVTLLSSIHLLWLILVNRQPFGELWHLLGWHIPQRRWKGKEEGGGPKWPQSAGCRTERTPAEGARLIRRQGTSVLPKGFSHVNLGQINWLAHSTGSGQQRSVFMELHSGFTQGR